MQLPNRHYVSGDAYRFGFQGQEGDDEWSGSGNMLAFKYRIHDARLGRFLSVDPLAPEYPWNSGFGFSENRMIDGVELEGLESVKCPQPGDRPRFALVRYTAKTFVYRNETVIDKFHVKYSLANRPITEIRSYDLGLNQYFNDAQIRVEYSNRANPDGVRLERSMIAGTRVDPDATILGSTAGLVPFRGDFTVPDGQAGVTGYLRAVITVAPFGPTYSRVKLILEEDLVARIERVKILGIISFQHKIKWSTRKESRKALNDRAIMPDPGPYPRRNRLIHRSPVIDIRKEVY